MEGHAVTSQLEYKPSRSIYVTVPWNSISSHYGHCGPGVVISIAALMTERVALWDVVGRHLTEFRSSREFVGAVADAMGGEVMIIPWLLFNTHSSCCSA